MFRIPSFQTKSSGSVLFTRLQLFGTNYPLLLVILPILLTPAYWNSNNTNARLVVFAPSLALDPTSGIHSHKTLDTAQPCHLLKPNWKPSFFHSISTPTNINTQFLLVTVCMCTCACVCVCVCVHIVPCMNCFGRTDLYMCISYLG